MKFRMKTMATLLVAVLIAMMGVMPALAADTGPIPMTVNVMKYIDITINVDIGDLAFVSVYDGAATVKPLKITVSGTPAADVGVDVTDTTVDPLLDPDLWSLNLKLGIAPGDPGLVLANDFVDAKDPFNDFVLDTNAILEVPSDTPAGDYTGTLVFWATPIV